MSAEDETTTEERPNVTILETLDPPNEAKAEVVEEEKKEEVAEEQNKEAEQRDDSGKFKPKNATQARIDEITRQRHEAQREAAYWRSIAEQAKEKEPSKQQDGEPAAEDFEDHKEYVRALARYEAKQILAEERAAAQEKAKASTWAERATAAKAEMPDFDEVMASSTAPMSHAMAEAIKESDIGPKVAYHLAQHPEEAARLANMSATSAAREIGRIEAALLAPKEAPTKKVTTAPTPPNPIGSGRSTVGDPSKMSMEDYMSWRNAQRKQK